MKAAGKDNDPVNLKVTGISTWTDGPGGQGHLAERQGRGHEHVAPDGAAGAEEGDQRGGLRQMAARRQGPGGPAALEHDADLLQHVPAAARPSSWGKALQPIDIDRGAQVRPLGRSPFAGRSRAPAREPPVFVSAATSYQPTVWLKTERAPYMVGDDPLRGARAGRLADARPAGEAERDVARLLHRARGTAAPRRTATPSGSSSSTAPASASRSAATSRASASSAAPVTAAPTCRRRSARSARSRSSRSRRSPPSTATRSAAAAS